MRKPVVFMYSGQGSQYYQMGRELYHNNKRFQFWMDYCNDIVQPLISCSLVDTIYGDNTKELDFDRVLFTNPALLAVQYSLTRTVMEEGLTPDYVMGHSLGEFVAAVVSGGFEFEDMARLVVRFAESLENSSDVEGAMLSVLESKDILNYEPETFKNTWLASSNFIKNFVVSGTLEEIQTVRQKLTEKNTVTQILPVKYAFHTPLMDSLESEFQRIGEDAYIGSPNIPIISCSKITVAQKIDVETLWRVARRPVEFQKTVEYLHEKGDYTFVDLGPSGTLATFVKYLMPKSSKSIALQCINPFGRDLTTFQKLVSHFDDVATTALSVE